MRKLQLLTAMAIGISASAIGSIQVEAATYTYFVDFSTKTVANFDDYNQMFFDSTYDLQGVINATINTDYRMNACPPSTASNAQLVFRYQLNGTGTQFTTTVNLPDMPCTTVDTFYQITAEISVPDEHIEYIINDDANFLKVSYLFYIYQGAGLSSRIVTLTNPEFVYSFEYQFNTTYLFNYFLSDQDYAAGSGTSGVVFSGTRIIDFDYVMTTAGDDEYFIINSVDTNFGTSRVKWAIDYNMEYFRGQSIGSRYKLIYDGTITYTYSSGVNMYYFDSIDYYYLNAATNSQAIVDAPEFDFEYEDCGWDVFDIPCFINNGLAYITNDAPIISDAITLLNAGIAMAAQTFGIIGAFTTDNVFGYLILAGFGYLAVRWFLKND